MNASKALCAVILMVAFSCAITVNAQSGCETGQISMSCGCYTPGQTETPPCGSVQASAEGTTQQEQTTSTPILAENVLAIALEGTVLSLLFF